MGKIWDMDQKYGTIMGHRKKYGTIMGHAQITLKNALKTVYILRK